jgi:glutamate/tyrosine decarboxylase-like PLP-dependent enzyme
MACSVQDFARHAELEEAIVRAREGGGIPFFVGATSGTTVLGGFDPLPDLADVSSRFSL